MRWKREDVRAFRDRDWSAFERAIVRLDAEQSIQLAASLYEQARGARPDWPSAAERDEDLAAHIRLSETFRRIFDAQRSRSRPR